MYEIYAGERLYRLRKRRGLSLEEVALGVGVTSSHISQIENGKRQPSFNLLADLANFFDVDPTFFIDTKEKCYGHGRKICQLRKEHHLSIDELAKQANLDVDYLKQVEEGRVKLDFEKLEQIAHIFGLELLEFYDGFEIHLNSIKEICEVVFNMTNEETTQAVNFIRKKIKLK